MRPSARSAPCVPAHSRPHVTALLSAPPTAAGRLPKLRQRASEASTGQATE